MRKILKNICSNTNSLEPDAVATFEGDNEDEVEDVDDSTLVILYENAMDRYRQCVLTVEGTLTDRCGVVRAYHAWGGLKLVQEKNLMELLEDLSCWSGRGVTVHAAEKALNFLQSISEGEGNDGLYSKYLEQMRANFPLCNAIGGSIGLIVRPGGEDEIDVNVNANADPDVPGK